VVYLPLDFARIRKSVWLARASKKIEAA